MVYAPAVPIDCLSVAKVTHLLATRRLLTLPYLSWGEVTHGYNCVYPILTGGEGGAKVTHLFAMHRLLTLPYLNWGVKVTH